MEPEIDKNQNFKNKLIFFIKENQKKLIFLSITIFTLIILTFYFESQKEKKNLIISEKYITSGLLLASGKKEESKIVYEEIILSKHKFYSILALNTILEKNLENNKIKILDFFSLVEKIKISKDQKDLLSLKKALYLIKNSNVQEGKKLLEQLSKSDMKLKKLSEEINLKK